MRRGLKWARRLLLGTLAFVIAAVGIALIVIHTDAGRRLIARQVESALAETFPGGIKIGRIEGSVFGELVVSDVTLNGVDGKPFLHIAKAIAEVSLSPLFGRTVFVDRLDADGVTLTNPRSPVPETPEEPPSGWVVDLAHIVVTNAKVVMDESPQGPVELADVAIRGRLGVERDGTVGIFAALRGHYTQRDVELRGIVTVRVADDITFPGVMLDLGGVTVSAAGGAVGAPAGTLFISAPARAVATLVPELILPNDAQLSIVATTTGAGPVQSTRVSIAAGLGAARLHGVVTGEQFLEVFGKAQFRGVITADDIDLALLSNGKVTGQGAAVIALSGTPASVHGTIIAHADVMTAPTVRALVAFSASPTKAEALLLASGGGGLRIAGAGGVRMEPEGLALSATNIGISVSDAFVASGGLAPVRGQIDLDAKVGGSLDGLAVVGKLTGTRVRVNALGVSRVRASFAGRVGSQPSGVASIVVDNVTNAGSPIGSAKLEATIRPDSSIAVVATARPAAAPLTADLSAIVSLGDVIDVALATHRIALPNGTWAGTGGHVRIDDRAITVTGFKSANGASVITADATIGRATSSLRAKVVAQEVALAAIDPAFKGTVDADISIERKGARWSGGGKVAAHKVMLAPTMLPLDATLDLGVDGRRVKVSAKLSNLDVGGAHVALEVDGPRDLTDGEAWKRVTRSDLHVVTIGFDTLNLRPLTRDRVAGIFDGALEIREGVPDGKLRVRGIPTPLGVAQADIALSLDDVGYIDVRGEGSVGDVGTATLAVRLAIPDRPFSTAAWAALGINVVHSASVKTSEIVVNPALLAKFGIAMPLEAKVTSTVTVGTGASSIDIALDANNITGGPLFKSIDAHVGARIDATATTAQLEITSGKQTLLQLVDARTPVSLDKWIADGAAALASTVTGTLSIPDARAVTLLGLFGRSDVTKGTVGGTITLGGTMLAPTAVAKLRLANILVRPRLAGKPPPEMTLLTVDAAWDGTTATAKIRGEEASKGVLEIDVSTTRDLKTFRGKVGIAKFDLAPVAAFLPGALVGASGTLAAKLDISGVDVSVGTTRGWIELTNGRMPITAILGTMRDMKLRIDLTDTEIRTKVSGKLGGGTVSIDAKADPRGVNGTLTGKIVKLSPIGFLAPQIDANIRGTLHRELLHATGDLVVTEGRVFIPEKRGNALLDEIVPEDLIFLDAPAPPSRRGRIPEKPFLVLDVNITPTRIEVPSFEALVENAVAIASGRVRVSVGETIGLDGEILVDRGSLTLFGHDYTVEQGSVAFDGTLDPMFDVKLSHEFPETTTYVRVSGRPSTIDYVKPELTADPGSYSESQLFGFLLGGSPSQDANQGSDLATGGAAVAFSQLKQFISKRGGAVGSLVNKLDVIRCNPTIGSTEASCTLGKWFGDDLFVSGIGKFTDQIDENTYEGRFQYFLRQDLTLDGTGGNKVQGLDLLLRRRF